MLRNAAIRHTSAFVQSHVLPCRLLEVGCGEGLLALELSSFGYEVHGIDTDAEVVPKAAARGVRVSCADILSYSGPAVDTVLFSRSLHHIHPPEQALERARLLLVPKGSILIEDFGVELVSKSAAGWRFDLSRILGVAMGSPAVRDFSADPLSRWMEEHSDHVAPFRELNRAVQQQLPGANLQFCPYLYRYLLEDLQEAMRIAELGELLLQWEEDLIGRGDLPAVGVRWAWRSPAL